jgi:hypothetical protein
MNRIEQASPELQLLMRRHKAAFWETTAFGVIEIHTSISGHDNQTESRRVTQEMLNAAKEQIETGIQAYRGSLDFPVAAKVKRGRPKYGSSK